MCRLQLNILLANIFAIIFITSSALAQESNEPNEPNEPTKLLLRANASIGGAYTTNLYLNASELSDSLGIARLALYSNWLPTDSISLKLSYAGDSSYNKTITYDRHYGHLGIITFGVRPTDALFTTIAAGGEQAYYPNKLANKYSFNGMFGRVGARYEIGDTSTLKINYQFRQDHFAKYDLDNRSHTPALQWDQAIGDYIEIRLPLVYESIYYMERYLSDINGNLTSQRKTSNLIKAEPTIIFMPSFTLRITGTLAIEQNNSNDTYYYLGPFGVEDPNINSNLIKNYDSYTQGSSTLTIQWETLANLTNSIRLGAGMRSYANRPAYDINGLATGEKEQDTWITPGIESRLRINDFLGLRFSYNLTKQWSNNALWDFTAHRVEIFLETWAGYP
ncbi:MAG: hypothetical protein JW841_05780 [Deltaproteobacteria bacterium]|nr:hypothetical protein [Deltaproteobacteria bacterium]